MTREQAFRFALWATPRRTVTIRAVREHWGVPRSTAWDMVRDWAAARGVLGLADTVRLLAAERCNAEEIAFALDAELGSVRKIMGHAR